ncbi:MAG: DUF3800 domain-containing protein [Patescibacteria group bacterium]
MKVMFLDESGDHDLEKIDKSYPIFCLAGCIVDFNYYAQIFEKRVDELKVKHFGTREIILRSYDIRKQKGEFSVLVDKKKRETFYKDLDCLVESLEFTVIASVINKSKLKKQYSKPSDPYELCFQFIMERFCMFLGEKRDVGIFRMESRQPHNDKILADDYEYFRQHGDGRFIKSEEVRRKLVDLSFNQKSQNIAGHQIADLVAYPIGSYILKPTKENIAFSIIEKKFHRKRGTDQYLNYGLKVFP